MNIDMTQYIENANKAMFRDNMIKVVNRDMDTFIKVNKEEDIDLLKEKIKDEGYNILREDSIYRRYQYTYPMYIKIRHFEEKYNYDDEDIFIRNIILNVNTEDAYKIHKVIYKSSMYNIKEILETWI